MRYSGVPPFTERDSKMKKHSTHLLAVVVSLVCLGMFGFASFPGNQLPKRSKADIVASDYKPTIDLEVKCYSLGRFHSGWSKGCANRTRQRLMDSGMFSAVDVGPRYKEYHLAIDMRNEGNTFVAALTGVLSGLTLTILPGYAKDEYILTAELSRDGTVLKTYKYEDYKTYWIQLFMLFAFDNNFAKGDKVADQVVDNMFWNLICDINRDNILKPSVP